MLYRSRLGSVYLFVCHLLTPRHDNDRKNPRTPKNIYDLNRVIAKRMEEIFLSRGIPVVPTIGGCSKYPLCDLIGFD